MDGGLTEPVSQSSVVKPKLPLDIITSYFYRRRRARFLLSKSPFRPDNSGLVRLLRSPWPLFLKFGDTNGPRTRRVFHTKVRYRLWNGDIRYDAPRGPIRGR
ncbi:hypothetical protein ElyMa_003602800 [Elysia marginata]|uniref:Uncharacterized protein n=1 Tax=Elysia marginata TaxID=1093978 RepID=A0AAV4ERL5_9GAST|nr:hypothetical protein ElyMa_003602800 [Elysia marginata]